MSFFTKLPSQHYDKTAFDDFRAERNFALGSGKAMAWLSQLAYETDEPDKVEDVLRSWGLQLVAPVIIAEEVRAVFPIASTHCFVAVGRGAVFLAFAGTDPITLANWITNFNARIGPTQTAEGYRMAAEAVLPQLRNVITATELANKKVFVTGHSLGGVLAVLIALRIERERASKIGSVYTFGMPRPGSPAFADEHYNPALGPCTYRLVHGNDLVPTLAPSELGFRHVGRLLLCDRGGTFDANRLAMDTKLDDPQFVTTVTKGFGSLLREPLSNVQSQLAQIKLAVAMAVRTGPRDMRDDAGGILIELLSPPLRDHMPDRYIAAFQK
jgi:triacylglycerol lipase